MPQELNGYGPTEGDYMGGTGGNLNERPDNSTPGGGMQGNAGDSNQGNDSDSATPTIVSSGIPAALLLRGGFFSFEIGLANLSKLVSSPLAMMIGSKLVRAYGPLAMIFPTPIAPEDMRVTQMPQLHATQVMPAKEIVNVDINTLPSLREAPVKARVSDVIDSGRQMLAVVSDKGIQTKAPVVEAKPTGQPQQFDVSVPGLSAPLRLDVVLPSAPQPKPNTEPDSKTFEKVVDQSAKSLYDGMLGGNTHDAIVTFPKNLGMEPVYIAVTRLLSEVELRQREENQAQATLQQRQAIREQAEQTFTRMAVAGVDEVTFYEQNKVVVEARLAEKQQQLAVMQARVVRLDAQARSARAFADLMQGGKNRERLDAKARAVAFEKEVSEGRVQIEGLWREISTLNEQVKNATTMLAQKVEAKAKAEEEARVKLAVLMALMAKAGVNPTPVYTPEMVKSAQASLAAAGAMVLNRALGMTQLSTFAEGVLTASSELSGSISGAVSRGAVALAEMATVSSVGALVVGFWPGNAIDKTLGSDRATMFGVHASLIAAGKVNIQPEMTSVNLPVRGFISVENGRQYANLVKTGVNGVSANVPVLRAVRDEKTGLDKITLPAVGGVPARTILVNPVPIGPAAPPHTGNSSPVPVTPVHTGTEIKQVASIVTTTYPADDLKDIRDFIYWQPDAAGTGVEPIYVMLSEPLDSGRFTRKQLDKKYLKHASDFGINDTKKNRETLTKFRDAIEAHLEDKGTVEKGTYLLVEDSKVFFNSKTNNVVVTSKDGSFISGWKLDVNGQQYKNYIEKGILR